MKLCIGVEKHFDKQTRGDEEREESHKTLGESHFHSTFRSTLSYVNFETHIWNLPFLGLTLICRINFGILPKMIITKKKPELYTLEKAVVLFAVWTNKGRAFFVIIIH